MTPRSQKAQEYRLIAAGSGGQGVLTIGKLISTAALREGNQVTYLPAYGSEVRGGTTSCHIVVSHERILSPVVEKPEIARALYAAVEVGQMIPESLYVAVAEILAMIMRIRRGL